MPSEFLKMGLVGRPHGIKGEISLDWQGEYTPAPGDSIWFGKDIDHIHSYTVKSARQHKDRMLMTLEGVQDRNAADALKGSLAFLRRSDLPPPGEDEEFLADLVGCQILDTNGDILGILDHLEFPAGQMLWSILDPSGKEILFPAREEFIENIDIARREIKISPPAGLLDIYRA